jgi:hypothetical protein
MVPKRVAVCAWCGPALVVFASLGFLLAGLLPVPLSPGSSPAKVVAFYGDHPDRVRAGFVLASLALGLVIPLIALITVQMLRMEGRTPLLSFTQAIAGAATGVLLLVPILLMATIAFRPDRDPQLTVTLNDIAWLLFITPIAPFMIQDIAIGVAVLGDNATDPVLPRWVGYLNLWVAFLFTPDILAFFFKSGPFAWNGVFVFWLAFTAYAVWAIVMGLVLSRSTLDDVGTQATVGRSSVAPPSPAAA